MALSTRSKIFYGWDVTENTRYIEFNDGFFDRSAIISINSYSPEDLAQEIAGKMSSVSNVVFSCTFDRATRKFNISAGTNFTLLFSSGAYVEQSIHLLLGFSSADKSGSSSYESDVSSGKEYTTQFIPQSYKPTNLNKKATDGVVNKTATGVIEVVKYGNERFLEFELLFITNIQQEVGSIIESSETGVEDYIDFIEYATEKRKIQFMPNYTQVESYQSFILESTEQSPLGLDYELIEMYDRGLANYYRSGKLKFRLQES